MATTTSDTGTNTDTSTGAATKLTLDQILGIHGYGGSEAPQWSPDGQEITWVSSMGGGSALWSANPQTGALTRLSAGNIAGGGLLTSYLAQWSPAGDHIAFISTQSGVDEVWLWSRDGSADAQLTTLGARVEALRWSPDGKTLLVSSNKHGVFDIFRVEVPSGKTKRLTNSQLNETYPSFTPDGRILYVRLNETWTDHEVILTEADGSEPRVVLRDENFFDYHYGRSFNYPKVSPDGTMFLFNSHRSGWINTWIAPVDGNGEPRQIAASEADQSDAVWSPDGKSIAYIENHNGTLDLRVVPTSGGAPRVVVQPEMGVCSGPDWSPDGKRISYGFGSPATPSDLWLVDVESGQRRQLTFSMLGGRLRERIAMPEKINYKSFDGLEIPAYLYRPHGPRANDSCPGIILAHGGPTSQFSDTWQPQVQFWVQEGYVVLLPNVRGSSGYGRPFEDMNNQDWGGGDLKDVVAGAEYLKTLPEVDGEHLGITGTSYGGIMTMNAVAFAPGVFQAAVSCSGYCDFLHMHAEAELRHVKLLEFEFGNLPEAADVYRRCSAIYRVHQATTPCFVLHGEGQYPGSINSKVFAMALEANYKPFWYKAYQGEHYYVRTQRNIRRMLLDMKAFFDFYLKGIPLNLPNDGQKPLTHVSGVINTASMAPASQPGGLTGTPPPDMAV